MLFLNNRTQYVRLSAAWSTWSAVREVPLVQLEPISPVLAAYTPDLLQSVRHHILTRMWAAQPDGRPAEHRWRPLFNAAKFGRRPLLDAVQ